MKARAVIATLLVGSLVAGAAMAQGPRYRFNQTNSPGWSLMTPAERTEHRKKMLAAKTYEECKAIQAENHGLMEARAKEKGKVLGTPRHNACDQMRAKGLLK